MKHEGYNSPEFRERTIRKVRHQHDGGTLSCTTKVLPVKKVTILLCTSVSIFIGLSGCYSEPGLPEIPEPRCEPRSTTEPSRLTLETSAENYGAIPPCEAIVSFVVMGNSPLRSVAGKVEVIGEAGEVLHERPFQVSLEGPSFGAFHNDVRIGPVDGHICRALVLDLELLHCRDEDDKGIECPVVKMNESHVLENFTVHGKDIDMCFDD